MRRRRILNTAVEGQVIVIEYGKYYPELVTYFLSKYGENQGTTNNPIPIQDNVVITGFPDVYLVNGIVSYIMTSTASSGFAVCFLLDNHAQTCGFVRLRGLDGYAEYYFYD